MAECLTPTRTAVKGESPVIANDEQMPSCSTASILTSAPLDLSVKKPRLDIPASPTKSNNSNRAINGISNGSLSTLKVACSRDAHSSGIAPLRATNMSSSVNPTLHHKPVSSSATKSPSASVALTETPRRPKTNFSTECLLSPSTSTRSSRQTETVNKSPAKAEISGQSNSNAADRKTHNSNNLQPTSQKLSKAGGSEKNSTKNEMKDKDNTGKHDGAPGSLDKLFSLVSQFQVGANGSSDASRPTSSGQSQSTAAAAISPSSGLLNAGLIPLMASSCLMPPNSSNGDTSPVFNGLGSMAEQVNAFGAATAGMSMQELWWKYLKKEESAEMKRMNEAKQIFTCLQCQASFQSMDQLVKHMEKTQHFANVPKHYSWSLQYARQKMRQMKMKLKYSERMMYFCYLCRQPFNTAVHQHFADLHNMHNPVENMNFVQVITADSANDISTNGCETSSSGSGKQNPSSSTQGSCKTAAPDSHSVSPAASIDSRTSEGASGVLDMSAASPHELLMKMQQLVQQTTAESAATT